MRSLSPTEVDPEKSRIIATIRYDGQTEIIKLERVNRGGEEKPNSTT